MVFRGGGVGGGSQLVQLGRIYFPEYEWTWTLLAWSKILEKDFL